MLDQNPYEPPEADLDPRDPVPKNSIWWRAFFSFAAVLMTLGILAIPFMSDLTLLDLIDFVASIIAFVGLFGFAYYKPIGSVVFWRYFFYFMLFESVVFIIVLPLIGATRYGQPTALDAIYLFEMIYAYVLLSALYFYAYRRPFVWTRLRS